MLTHGIRANYLLFCRYYLQPVAKTLLELNHRTLSNTSPEFAELNLSLKNKKVEEFIAKQGTDSPWHHVLQAIKAKQIELVELEALAKENVELKDIAALDAIKIQETLSQLENKFFSSLVQGDEADNNDIILEVSAGVGGQEAMLFAQEIFQMYKYFANSSGCTFETLNNDVTEIGGIRHASASISGRQVYRRFKFEGGVHRVQRVPQTEKSGRIHTSTCAVAILPQPSEIQVVINPQDLKIETKKASGAGGQHVNTTESAVRVTHIPSGISVESQSERSQVQNRSTALRSLRAKLYAKRLEEQAKKYQTARKLQVGFSSRSEKIRTYNVPSNRVTDHRISHSIHNLRGVLDGGSSLHELIQKLLDFDRQERLLQVFE